MYQDLCSFQKLYNNKEILMYKKSLDKIIQKFQFFVIQQNNRPEEETEKQMIKEQKNESKIIIVDQLKNPYDEYLIIVFDQMIIVLHKSDQEFLINLLNQHVESTIFTVSDRIKSILPTDIQLKLYQYEEPFKSEYLSTIDKFSANFSIKKPKDVKIKQILELIGPIISSYFINKSYAKLQEERQTIYEIERQKIELKDDNYIELQYLGQSNTSIVQLIFHCETEQLFAIKRLIDLSEKHLFSRELKNYQKNIRHPNLPIFYGTAKINKIDCLIIEYIRGKSLIKIDELKLEETDKINIIFQLMLTIEFLQSKKLIYRDLKPNNLIFNSQRNLILIDFDRMIGIDEQEEAENRTKNFNNPYMAPELLNVNFDKYTYKEDVYSIGHLIYYIITQRKPIDNYAFNNLSSSYDCLISLYKNCIKSVPKQRPTITKIIDYFYNNLISQSSEHIKYDNTIDINETNFYPLWKCNEHHFIKQFMKGYEKEINEKYLREINTIHLFYQFKYGLKYYPEKYFTDNISTFISFLSSISDDNQTKSRFYLGLIYYEGKYISRDINKSIHYFTLAANQNNSDAQSYLGFIYYEGEYISRDINKSIHYFTLSANQNNSDAQCILGFIYYEGEYISRDINKSIHYFTLAANQNNSDAQSYLGKIYYEGEYISRDINKSIHYFTLAANQNNSKAQSYLGKIYYEGEYISRDINKSIHYFTLAANQNDSNAQCILGLIYSEGKYISRDINKSIHYFTLAVNQNNSYAQFYLGKIYYEGEYISRDINKSIHYYTLAANQNNLIAQFYLGKIYYEGKYISRDINKSIHYFTLAANQNNSNEQRDLGKIYYEGEYNSRDINKSIHYYTLVANQSVSNAQSYLGKIYYEGEYISRDINKSIHYLTLAANQNDSDAQCNLGFIYYEGEYISRDISKSIHYLTLSANQNNSYAQYYLGKIYYEGEYISRDINKSIHYFTLAANQNDSNAQCILGLIYSEGKYISRDINKSIHYFTLAVNQNNSYAQSYLGKIYIEGKYISRDINKSIHYYTLAANQCQPIALNNLAFIYQNGEYVSRSIEKAIHYYSLASKLGCAEAQLNLGLIYCDGELANKDVNKGIDYLMQSSKNRQKYAHFHVGFSYHEGNSVLKQDIFKAIHYYKEASNVRDMNAKNNLGIIYKSGFSDKILPNIQLSIEYFKESIRLNENPITLYNLSHVYIYKCEDNELFNEAIEKLISSISMNESFSPSYYLLALALLKKYEFKIENIKQFFEERTQKLNQIQNIIEQIIDDEELYDENKYNIIYEYYRNIDFLYDFHRRYFESRTLNMEKTNRNQIDVTRYNITAKFYEGFYEAY